MTSETRTLGWAGLSPHEAETVRLVSEIMNERLTSSWHLDESARDDVVLADPQTRPGREALSLATRGIVVLERTTQVPRQCRNYLVRPLRPRTIVEAMNETTAATDVADSDWASAPAGESKSLATALHEATREADAEIVHVIDGLCDTPLIVDPAADRLRGPIEAVDVARLLDAAPVTVRRMSRVAAEALNTRDTETACSSYLWRTVCTEAEESPLFGDLETAGVHLERWPSFSAMRLPRVIFRVATHARYETRTVRQLAAETGTTPGPVIALCNAAWLTGYLQVTELPRTAPPRQSGMRTSLANRIRRRLGTV